jgi:cholesterol transport system auxiliary component
MKFRPLLRRAAVVLALGTFAFVAGCGFTRQSPVKETYLLDPAVPSPVAKAQTGSLRVGAVNVAAPFRARNFVVRDTELQYESDFYHEFIVPPALMFTDATARSLVAAKVFVNVSRPGVTASADWVLDGFVSALYADTRDAKQPAAVIEVTYYLSRDDGGVSSPVWSQAYRKQIAVASSSTSVYVSALNTALSEILADLARDLAAASLPKS